MRHAWDTQLLQGMFMVCVSGAGAGQDSAPGAPRAGDTDLPPGDPGSAPTSPASSRVPLPSSGPCRARGSSSSCRERTSVRARFISRVRACACVCVCPGRHTRVNGGRVQAVSLTFWEASLSQDSPPAERKGSVTAFNPSGSFTMLTYCMKRPLGTAREPDQQMHPSSLLLACR